MSDRDIRAYLRGAVAVRILDGWCRSGADYVIAMYGTSRHFTVTRAAEYCAALLAAGVRPLYRDSEPTLIDFEG